MNEDHAQKAIECNRLGNMHFLEGKWHDACAAYQAAIAHQPHFPHAHYNLGLVYNKLANKQEAKQIFQNLIDLMPEHDPGRFQLAAIFMQEEDYFIALSHYLFILERYPQHTETLVNAGTCYFQLGKLIEANVYYSQALDIIPEDKQILFNLGVIAMQLGRFKEAIPFYLQIVNQVINPHEIHSHFSAHNNLGVIYLTLKDRENALLHFRAALQLQANNANILHIIHIIENKKSIDAAPLDYVRTLFNSYAHHYDSHLLETLRYAVPQCMHDVLISHVNLLPNQTLLDLGCGTGLMAERLSSYSLEFTGVDIAETMLKIAE